MDGAPHGVALPSHTHPEERPLCTDGTQSNVLLPAVPMEEPPCDALIATTELPAEALPAVSSTVPPTEADTDLHAAELPPCTGSYGASASEVPSTVVLQMPAEQPPRLGPRGRCLIHNWQEERATNHLDIVQGQEQGSEGFIHRHGHPRLLYHHHLPGPNNSTTMDTYCLPHSVLMPGQGQREATLKAMLYHKYREEMLKKISPPRMPMESMSVTHQDYKPKGCLSAPSPPSQPHDYLTEQPCSFWLEQARSLTGVTSIRSRDSPFRKDASFSTPITESLDQPPPCAPLTSRVQSHKQ
ncbi:sperm-associated antigen 8 isoform X2 [Neopsephotus bourkii]|uniref:sperm-associated antigen 8 isoform X2 n=1 Tax=Neopsephotus bourkii TaxID=309878 RepID=UPI002AA59722|nr:sperm-associated antigen 8 isoform X2 [Neopsephotus bourkii]